MLICSFGVGITTFAVANQSSSTRGGASGSSRMDATISSSVMASNRVQSICGWTVDLADFCFEAPLLTLIRLSIRDDPAISSAPREENGHQTAIDFAVRQDAGLTVIAPVVYFF